MPSNVQTIVNNIRRNLAQDGFRFFKGTTTASGGAGGISIICSNLTGGTDAWKYCQVQLLDGSFGEMTPRRVEGFNSSAKSLDFTNNSFEYQVPGGVAFEIYDGGNFSSWKIRSFVADAARHVLKNVRLSDVHNYELQYERSGTVIGGRGVAELPNGILSYPGPHQPFTRTPKVKSGNYSLTIIPDDRWYFIEGDLDAGVIPQTGDIKYVGYIDARRSAGSTYSTLTYLPAISEVFIFSAIPEPAFDSSGNWSVPPSLWGRIEKVATAEMLASESNHEQAKFWLGMAGMKGEI